MIIEKIVINKLRCERCGHEWNSEKNENELPRCCPNQKCHSPYWNTERVRIQTKEQKPVEIVETVKTEEIVEKVNEVNEVNDFLSQNIGLTQ